MTAKLSTLFVVAVSALSSSAFAGETRVTHVYSGRQVVAVRQEQAARPYALTGREQVKKVQYEAVKVGDRTVGYVAR